MHICAILIAKPSMQVLYERVLRRPYPRSQRHVYIGTSQPFAVPQIRSFSMTFPFHPTFLWRENNISCLFSSVQKKKIIPTAAQFFFTTVLKCLCLHAHLEWKWHSGSLESVVSLVIQTFSTSFSAGIFKTTHVIFSKWVMEGNHIHPVSLPPQNNLT